MGHPGRLEELRARNADMREQMESALSTVARQTTQLAELQAAAAAVTAQACSADGLASAQVNAAGTATGINLAPTAFDRSTPAKLQRSVLQALQTAAARAADARAAILEPLQIELSELSGFGALPRLPHNSAAPDEPRRAADEDIDFTDGVW